MACGTPRMSVINLSKITLTTFIFSFSHFVYQGGLSPSQIKLILIIMNYTDYPMLLPFLPIFNLNVMQIRYLKFYLKSFF